MKAVSKIISIVIAAAAAMQYIVPVYAETGAETNTAPDAPTGLLTNELEEPLNVQTPYFSWLVNDADENDIQSAYRITVTDGITGETAWDSGRVESSEQSYIECGTELKAGYPYSWSVMTWDSAGLESPYSDAAYFATGLDTADWGAEWICSGGNGSNHFWYARYETELDSGKTVDKALAYFAGVHDYELNINGNYIGRGQSFDYASETRYQGHDITAAVGGGSIAIGLLNRYYGSGQGRAASREALLGHINIYYTDGTSETIVTNGDWRVSQSVPVSGSSKRNGEGDFVEDYNARAEQIGYSESGFDASGWSAASVIGAHPTDEFTAVTPELSRVTDYIVKPVSLTVLDDGSTVADFGTVIPARPVITFKNGTEGTRFAVQTGYELTSDGHVDTSTDSTQSTDMRFIYTQRGGEQTYSAWDHLGFRYLSVPECGEVFTEDTITARVVHTNVLEGRDSTLVTSNEMLNSVYDMMKRSALYSIQNSFVDTPTREKGQFLQDSINISDASTTALYERAASKKAIDQFLASADRYWTGDEAGRYNSVYPNGDGKRDIPDFTINLPYWVWSYYMQTGDRSTLEKAYPYIKATADYISGNINDETGLVTMLSGGDGSPNSYQYGIVDWPAVGRFGYDWSGTKSGARTTVNMLSNRTFDVAALAAAELGNTADADDMAVRSENLKTAINERLINGSGVYCDGLNASGGQVSGASQHATSYALAFDIAPESMRADMADYIAAMGMKQGPMTADILAKALFNSGEYAAALKLFTEPNDNGWAKEISKGYTFTWEAWNADTTENSQSHGWGAAAAKDILECFAGVTVTEPGAARVRIEPVYCDLTSLDASVSTERGNVGVSYSRSDTDYDITVTIPSNMTAELVLPIIGESEFVRRDGAAIDSELTQEGQIFTLGGGTYSFSYNGDITVLPEEVVYDEPLPEGIFGDDDTANSVYNWTIGASDAAAAGTIYEEKNNYADLLVSLGRGDRLEEGIMFTASSVKEPTTSGQASLGDTKRYIAVTAKRSGTLSMTISFDSASSSRKNRVYYADLGADADLSATDLSSYSKGSHSVIEGDITTTAESVKTLDMTEGHTYIIYTYQSGSTISALSYAYTGEPATPSPTATTTPTVTATPTPSATPTLSATPTPTAAPIPAEKIEIVSRLESDGRLDHRVKLNTDEGGILAAAAYDTDGGMYSMAVKVVEGSDMSISVNIPDERPCTVKIMLWDGLDTMRPVTAVYGYELPTVTEPPEHTGQPTDEPEYESTQSFVFGAESGDDIVVLADTAYGKQPDGMTYGLVDIDEDSAMNDFRFDGFTDDIITYAVNGKTGGMGYVTADHSRYDEDTLNAFGDGVVPIRFAAETETGAYYTVSATIVNTSETESTSASLFGENRYAILYDYTLAPGESVTRTWNVNLVGQYYNATGAYRDTAVNVAAAGENVGLVKVEIKKHKEAGQTIWLMTDSTGDNSSAKLPYFGLRGKCGVGQMLTKYLSPDIAVNNQGEGGLSSSDKAHFNNALPYMNPGDYLYIQYGFNGESTESLLKNLPRYYEAAQERGVKMIVVSTTERQSSSFWNSETGTWTASNAAIAAAGKQYVEELIAGGADDIAFIDLNTAMNAWMNETTADIYEQRLRLGFEDSAPSRLAMNYYYGYDRDSGVDSIHINDAGADNAAYLVMNEIQKTVSMGGVQAEVLKGLTQNAPGSVPYTVTDEIVSKGWVPNESYPYPLPGDVTYEYPTIVKGIDTEGGRLVSMTVMVQGDMQYYAQGAADILDGDGNVVNTVYSSSTDVNPLIGHIDNTACGYGQMYTMYFDNVVLETGQTVRAYTAALQSGETKPSGEMYSSYYTEDEVERVLLDETFDNGADNWKEGGSSAVKETSVVTKDGKNALKLYQNGSGTYNVYRRFDNNAEVANGVVKVHFMLCHEYGSYSLKLTSETGSGSYINGIRLIDVKDGTITFEDGTEIGKVKTGKWTDVECRADLINGTVIASVAGGTAVTAANEKLSGENAADLLPLRGIAIAYMATGSTIPSYSFETYISELRAELLHYDDPSETRWSFSKFADSAQITADGEKQVGYDGMTIHINSGDTVTENGVYWSTPGTTASNSDPVTNNRYITYTPSQDGTLTLTFSGSKYSSKSKAPRMYIVSGEDASCMSKTNSDENGTAATASAANSDTVLAAQLSAGTTYYIWPYYYNDSGVSFNVSYITFKKAEAAVSTRNIYGSDMLLQRGEPVVIDGKADAAGSVSVTLTNETTGKTVQTVSGAAVSADGSWNGKAWSVTLDPVTDYESSYSLTIAAEGAEPLEYTNILFGDLYLFTGQSNMWKQVSYYKNIGSAAYGTAAVAANATDRIRVMHTAGSGDYGTAVLQYDAQNAQPWRDFSTYNNVSDISAPAYTAAVTMYKETGVPIGLITNAYPGSYISSWFDSALAIDACNLGKNGSSNERNWYCGRIYPLRNLKLSGVFWYQGEADAATTYHDEPYAYYSEMLPKLISSWRELFADDTLPFYYVQLSRIGTTIVDENNPDTGAAGKMPIKLAQTDVYLDMEDKTNVGIISTLDLYGNHNADGTANCRTDIHLGQKDTIGKRMAAYALGDIYGLDTYKDGTAVYRHGPIYKSSIVSGDKIEVTFECGGQLKIMPSEQYTDSEGERLTAEGAFDPSKLNEFEIAGADGVWYAAEAEITGVDTVTVRSDNVASPVKVRYCGSDYPESPNLTDDSGMPSYVFEKTAAAATVPTEAPSPTATAAPTEATTPTPDSNIEAVYKFDFGGAAAEGWTAVTPDMVYDMSLSDSAAEGELYGFLGTTDTSYADDVLPYDCDARAIDGFSLVKGQRIDLAAGGTESETDASSDYVTVPKSEDYIPSNASSYEGRFPIRFSMKAENGAYYTVTATLANASDTENACVSLFSEKRQIVAEDVMIAPDEKISFTFSVDIEDVCYKTFPELFRDDMLNICVAGENAALVSLVVEKHAKTEGTIRGAAADGVNDGVTLWACTDSTGCDCPATVPFFALQNYAGVAQAFVKYMPENIAVSNQGERGLASNDNAHLNRCMLKAGDYLYVEYGHNESSADSYKANLEKYYTLAHESGANLIIASPVNRHNNYTSENGWMSDFTSYIAAAEAFVKEKIDGGADDIAFVDLNTPYVEWMNEETARITSLNPSLSPSQAMDFYYRSVKGSSVDGTHLNDAGADRAAYCFFTAAQAILAAADGGADDAYVLSQAEVLRPIAEGMKTKIGDSDRDNLPMTVSEEIITAGSAPNAYWDTVPSDAMEYTNSIAIESVGAVTDDGGAVTIDSVGIRLMNGGVTYAKAEIAVTENGEKTVYYTESNYDCTGDEAGTVKVNSGFITSDKAHDEVTEDDRLDAITVPYGAECTVRIVSCDDNWVVGDSPEVYSASYSVYPESAVLFDEDGSSTDGWSRLTGAASRSETVMTESDGTGYISIVSSNADSNGTKKNYGFYKALNEGISTGRYRFGFKTRFGSGAVRFALASSVGSASNPFPQKVYVLGINGGNVYINTDDMAIPTYTDDSGAAGAAVRTNEWVNVDSIIDLDSGTISISVAGSEYAAFDISDWQSESPSTLPVNYFGIAGSSDGTPTAADIKDIRMARLYEPMPEGARVWDFSGYTEPVTAETETEHEYDGLDIHLGSGDSITDGGIYWAAPGGTKSDGTTVVSNNRYIVYTPETNGTLSVTFSGSKYHSSSKAPRMYVITGDDASCMTKNNSGDNGVSATATAANAPTVVTAELEAGKTYYIWAYYYGDSSAEFTVSKLTFVPAE